MQNKVGLRDFIIEEISFSLTFSSIRKDTRRPTSSRIAGAKKVFDALENDTQANFQENIPGKEYDFRQSEGHGHPAPPLPQSP